MASKEELLAKLSECVVEMEDEEVVEVAKEYNAQGDSTEHDGKIVQNERNTRYDK